MLDWIGHIGHRWALSRPKRNRGFSQIEDEAVQRQPPPVPKL